MLILFINTKSNFWIQNENMRTVDLHLGLSKSPTGTKIKPKWSSENSRLTRTSIDEEEDEEKEKYLSAGAVYAPDSRFRIIN